MFKSILGSALITLLFVTPCFAEAKPKAFSMEDYLKKTGKEQEQVEVKPITANATLDFDGAIKKKQQSVSNIQYSIDDKRKKIRAIQRDVNEIKVGLREHQRLVNKYGEEADYYYVKNQGNASDHSRSQWRKYSSLKKKYAQKANAALRSIAKRDKKAANLNRDIKQAISKLAKHKQKIVEYENKHIKQKGEVASVGFAGIGSNQSIIDGASNSNHLNIKKKLLSLKALHADGLITNDEYARKKGDLLNRL